MKRFLALMLSLVLTFVMSTSTLAAEPLQEAPTTTTNYFTEETATGQIHVRQLNTKTITIITNDEQHQVDISIKYAVNPDLVYQWSFTEYPMPTASKTLSFWDEIINYVESNLDSATIVTFTDVIYDTPIDVSLTRSSAAADMMEQMEEDLGTGEYFDNLIHTTTYQGKVFRIYESMDFRVLEAGYKSWSTTITIASLITSVLGLTPTTALVSALCSAFGVATSTASLAAGKINLYTCRGMNYRYVTINGSNYIYNITHKFYDYNGYENGSHNNIERAYIDTGSLTINAIDGFTYFNSYTSQVEDAYDEFLLVGQQN